MEIVLPPRINAEKFLPFIAELGSVADREEIRIDFARLQWVSPAVLVSLVATVVRWLNENRHVEFQNLHLCSISGYLQRMNLLKICKVGMEENFVRRDSWGRFSPVRLIDHRVEALGAEMASCLAPGGEDYEHALASLYDLAWYVITEIANNARQHSKGLGYTAAQTTQHDGLVRIAVADNGSGILQSFKEAGCDWSREADDATAIVKALEPRVSSKFSPNNEGVGLTLVSELAKLTQAWLLIVSGDGVVRMNRGAAPMVSRLPNGAQFRGTLIAMAVEQIRVGEFAALLEQAKVQAGLLQPPFFRGRFEA